MLRFFSTFRWIGVEIQQNRRANSGKSSRPCAYRTGGRCLLTCPGGCPSKKVDGHDRSYKPRTFFDPSGFVTATYGTKRASWRSVALAPPTWPYAPFGCLVTGHSKMNSPPFPFGLGTQYSLFCCNFFVTGVCI